MHSDGAQGENETRSELYLDTASEYRNFRHRDTPRASSANSFAVWQASGEYL